ncbi:MAG: RNA polymerase sigma factor [Desulfobacterales bacterium]|jgi:RNA polymerase sigma-70 factor (ECF subfamily)
MASTDDTNKTSDTSTQLVVLVNQAKDGNRSAFARLVDQFQADVYRMVYYRIRSGADAEDIAQDVFLKAYQKISSIKDASRFRGWLFSITLNRIRDFQRKKRFRALFKVEDENIETQPPAETGTDQPDALDHVLREDFWRQIRLMLDKLSKMEREVFLLRFFDHLNLKEIAGILRKNESTIKTHLYRALAKFKKEPGIRQLLKEIIQ